VRRFSAEETRVALRAASVMRTYTHLFYCPGARGEENKCLLNVNIKHETRASQSLGSSTPRFYFYSHDGRNFCGCVVGPRV
jgi:hypothetical protein